MEIDLKWFNVFQRAMHIVSSITYVTIKILREEKRKSMISGGVLWFSNFWNFRVIRNTFW